jgi:hypothetical protein
VIFVLKKRKKEKKNSWESYFTKYPIQSLAVIRYISSLVLNKVFSNCCFDRNYLLFSRYLYVHLLITLLRFLSHKINAQKSYLYCCRPKWIFHERDIGYPALKLWPRFLTWFQRWGRHCRPLQQIRRHPGRDWMFCKHLNKNITTLGRFFVLDV